MRFGTMAPRFPVVSEEVRVNHERACIVRIDPVNGPRLSWRRVIRLRIVSHRVLENTHHSRVIGVIQQDKRILEFIGGIRVKRAKTQVAATVKDVNIFDSREHRKITISSISSAGAIKGNTTANHGNKMDVRVCTIVAIAHAQNAADVLSRAS